MTKGTIAFKIPPAEYELWKSFAKAQDTSLAGMVKGAVRLRIADSATDLSNIEPAVTEPAPEPEEVEGLEDL
jgi:hypothetical protein